MPSGPVRRVTFLPEAGAGAAWTFQDVSSNWSQHTSWPALAQNSSWARTELKVSRYSLPGAATGRLSGIRTSWRLSGATSRSSMPEATTSSSAVRVQPVL